ncbi:MAG: galactokinase [Spirochaetia bacterium]|nr:galactokinase [Spirochaetia bacterium]
MEEIIEAHKKEFGTKPDVIARAPGHFHLAGEHTWFFRDKTLSMACDFYVYVSVSFRDDQNVKFNFAQMEETKKCSLSSLKFKKEDKWSNALKSVLHGFASMGFNLRGVNVTVYSDILPSAGFGITTASKVAFAWAMKELCGFKAGTEILLQVLERGSRNFLQNDNFMADVFSAVYSKENNFVLTDYAKKSHDLIPFKFKDKTILLTDARVPRIVTWNEESLFQPENVLLLGELKEPKPSLYGGWHYEESKSEVNEVLSVVHEETKHRLLCIMQEHKCILDCVSAVEKCDFASFARAITKSHEGMRDLYDVSCPEIDWILKRVSKLDENPDDLRTPVNCGRITGKGFGRGVYTFLRSTDVEKYQEKLFEYSRIFGFEAKSYVVKPGRGVCLV